MTEPTFWEDESPLIRLIAGEEWTELKRICPRRVSQGYYVIGLTTPRAQELYQKAEDKLEEAYGKIIQPHFNGVAFYKLQDRLFQVSYPPEEIRDLLIEINVMLPDFGSRRLPFPELTFNMLHDPELAKGENIKQLISLETKFLDVFEEQGYVFQSTSDNIATRHFTQTKVSKLEELDKLFSDIRKVYDSLGGKK